MNNDCPKGIEQNALMKCTTHRTGIALLLGLLLVMGFASCSDLSKEETQQVAEALNDSLTTSTETWGVDMEIIEDGLLKVRVLGSYATTQATKYVNQTNIKGPVTIHVYDSTGAITTRVSSERAVYRAEQAIFELYGDVNVNTVNNRHLESEYLEWHQGDNNLQTSRFVIIETPTDSLAGTGFEGTTDLTRYTIKEPQGRVTVD